LLRPNSVPALRQTRHGPGILVSLPSGSVAGDLRAVGRDNALRRTTYELVLTNETFAPIAAYTYAIGQAPDAGANWRTVTVPPFTSIAVTIDVPFPPRGSEQRVVAEVHADEAHWTIDAHGPRVIAHLPKPATIAISAALLLAALACTGYVAFGPRVTALAAPASVAGGNDFQIAYATSGTDRIRWHVENADGVELRGGSTREPHGAISLQLPPATRSEGYDVRIDATSLLGSQTRTVHVVAVPDPAKIEPVRIGSLFVASQSIASGKPIVITYRTNASEGTVSLLDQSDNVRASAPLVRAGTTSLPAPPVADDQAFRIVLDASRNGVHAQSSVGITVLGAGGAPPAAASAADAAGANAAGANAAGTDASGVDAPASIALEKQRYRSGEAISIGIARNPSPVHVAVANSAGAELTSDDLLPGERRALLRAPDVDTTTSLLVVATFGRGVGQETVVRTIVIAPSSK
jgi:hypothetical protein